MSATSSIPQTMDRPFTFGWRRMLLLAFAVFTTVTVELMPAGLLPSIAADFDVGISTVGLLLTVWALTIAVASLPLVRLLRTIGLRSVLVGALAAMAAANILVAVAPVFEFAVAGRILAAAAHGVFWSIVMVYASAIAPPAHAGRAVAVVGSGGTAAILVGIPLGAAFGGFGDWRLVFVLLAALMAGAAAAIRFALPPVPSADAASTATRLAGDPTLVPIALVGLVQFLVALAQFTLFTYIAPFVISETRVPESAVSVLLLVFGLGGLAGLVAVGITADRWPRASLIVAVVALSTGLLAVAAAPDVLAVVAAGLIVWGASIGALPPLLLARTLRLASPRTRSLASTAAVVCFNLGIGAGAWFGGALADGPGLRAAALAATLTAVAALIVTVWSFRLDRSRA